MHFTAHTAPDPTRPSGEAGTVLVLFALLLVGAFGLLGVVIDGGRLRIAKQQLDAGAECAALEGLRFKDREGDSGRRNRAITATEWQWDDDLNADNGDRLGLGAGSMPIVYDAQPLGGRIVIADNTGARAYKPAPDLEANLGNARHGDLVAGTHVAGATAQEDDAFQRPDFTPAAPGSSPAALASASSFLVRLRRATGRLPLDRQDNESSAGPAFEWLWARGSAWQEPGAAESNQSRANGVTVRATAIAAADRALFVASDPTGGPQLTTIALRGDTASAWHATVAGATLTLDIDPTGLLTSAGAEEGVTLLTTARVVGESVATAAAPPTTLGSTQLIVAAYGLINGTRRVIGFTLASATITGATIVITRSPAAVLATGASSISPSALDARLALASDPTLGAMHLAVAEPVLAPSLRR